MAFLPPPREVDFRTLYPYLKFKMVGRPWMQWRRNASMMYINYSQSNK
jgi:hypothetical protein